MNILGVATILLFYTGVIGLVTTERKQWLIILPWCLPIFFMVFMSQYNVNINGLVVVICYGMIFSVIYSLWGVKLWCTQTRKKHGFLTFIVATWNIIVSTYVIYQSVANNYFFFIEIENKLTLFIFSVSVSLAVAAMMHEISIVVIDRYFSKREEFPLIDCSSNVFEKKENSWPLSGNKRKIKGVQNGVHYIFNLTSKSYSILKPEKTFLFSVKRGVLGGVYVTNDIYNKHHKRSEKRTDKILLYRAIISIIILTCLTVIASAAFWHIA